MKKLASALTVAGAFFVAPLAQAVPIHYATTLDQNEPVPTGSAGTGTVFVTIDTDIDRMVINAAWSGLGSPTTVAHIHCCTAVAGTGAAGVAVDQGTLPGFPIGVTSGSYSVVINLADAGSYGTAFLNAAGSVAAAEQILATGLADGKAYFNVHTQQFPGGEIRGFFRVPEPASLALLGLGLLGIGFSRRKLAA